MTQYSTLDDRMAVLMAMYDNRDNELITQVCESFLRMFSLKHEISFIEASQPQED